jgi:hypothetical protein
MTLIFAGFSHSFSIIVLGTTKTKEMLYKPNLLAHVFQVLEGVSSYHAMSDPYGAF